MKRYQTLSNMSKWKKASIEQERKRKCNCTQYVVCVNCLASSFKQLAKTTAKAWYKY